MKTKSLKNLLLILALSSLLIGAESCEKNQYQVYRDWEQFEELGFNTQIENWMRENDVTGMGVAIYHKGSIFANGYGYEDKRNLVDSSKTLFRLASVSKTVNATLAYIASDYGLLDIEAPITDYYPAYKKPATLMDGTSTNERMMTLGDLMSHTAGIQHYSNGKTSGKPPGEKVRRPIAGTGFEFALNFWISNPLINEVATASSYSSFGVNLAGVVIEKAIQKEYPELTWQKAINAWINTPLRITSLKVDYEGEINPKKSMGFEKDGNYSSSYDVSWKAPGGGLMATVEDMARFCGGLVSQSLLTPLSLETMWKKRKLDNGVEIGNTTGFFKGKVNGRVILDHGGSQNKARSYLIINPESETCVMVMTNADFDIPVAQIGQSILDQALNILGF